jgi:hypothetical protein
MVTFRQFLAEGHLQKANLNANPDRLINLVDKLEKREPFVLKGQTVPSLVVDVDPVWLADVKSSGKLKTDYILDKTGKKIPLNTLEKTTEFGSSGRKGTEKEAVQLDRLGDLIKELGGGDPIDIKVGNKIFKNCIDVKNTHGTPKSDFEIVDTMNKSIIFISHKDGDSPKKINQWSGITDYINYPEVSKFVSDVRKKVGSKMPRATSLSRPIKDMVLKSKACFGKDFGSPNFGINNVNCIIQGEVSLTPKQNFYELGGFKMWLNGDTPSGEYTPVLAAIYKGKGRRDQNIEGARFSIYAIGGRKYTSF